MRFLEIYLIVTVFHYGRSITLTLGLINHLSYQVRRQLWVETVVDVIERQCDKHITLRIPSESTNGDEIKVSGFIVSSDQEITESIIFVQSNFGRAPIIWIDFSGTPSSIWNGKLFHIKVSERVRDVDSQLRDWIDVNICRPADYVFNENSHLGKLVGKPKEVPDLNGQVLKIGALEGPPFVSFVRDTKGNIIDYRGFSFEIIKTLQKKFNFAFTVHLPPDNSYGNKMMNGTWDGMIGTIIRGEVDMSATELSITHIRYQDIDFTAPFYQESTAILIPPATEDTRILACLRPFTVEVWLILLFVMMIIPLILWAHLQYLWSIGVHYFNQVQLSLRDLSLFRQYFFMFAVITLQSGTNVSSVGHSPRLLAAVWCLCTVVFIYVYVGILVPFLSVPKLRPIVNSLEDLRTSPIDWGVRHGTATESYFTEAKEGIFRALGDELLRRPELLSASHAEGVKRVVQGNYAFIKSKSSLEFAIEKNFLESGECRLSLAKQELFDGNVAFGVA